MRSVTRPRRAAGCGRWSLTRRCCCANSATGAHRRLPKPGLSRCWKSLPHRGLCWSATSLPTAGAMLWPLAPCCASGWRKWPGETALLVACSRKSRVRRRKSSTMKIAIFPGDGIGPEVTREAVRMLQALDLPGMVLFEGDVGGVAYHRHGHPLPAETLEMARAADAVLFGAVGDPACDGLERHLRPEQAIPGLRQALGLFANLRPATMFSGLEDLSALRPEVARSIDLLIVRELNGDVYFGEKAFRTLPDVRRQGYDFMSYA